MGASQRGSLLPRRLHLPASATSPTELAGLAFWNFMATPRPRLHRIHAHCPRRIHAMNTETATQWNTSQNAPRWLVPALIVHLAVRSLLSGMWGGDHLNHQGHTMVCTMAAMWTLVLQRRLEVLPGSNSFSTRRPRAAFGTGKRPRLHGGRHRASSSLRHLCNLQRPARDSQKWICERFQKLTCTVVLDCMAAAHLSNPLRAIRLLRRILQEIGMIAATRTPAMILFR